MGTNDTVLCEDSGSVGILTKMEMKISPQSRHCKGRSTRISGAKENEGDKSQDPQHHLQEEKKTKKRRLKTCGYKNTLGVQIP